MSTGSHWLVLEVPQRGSLPITSVASGSPTHTPTHALRVLKANEQGGRKKHPFAQRHYTLWWIMSERA